jgi:hypothetical protein
MLGVSLKDSCLMLIWSQEELHVSPMVFARACAKIFFARFFAPNMMIGPKSIRVPTVLQLPRFFNSSSLLFLFCFPPSYHLCPFIFVSLSFSLTISFSLCSFSTLLCLLFGAFSSFPSLYSFFSLLLFISLNLLPSLRLLLFFSFSLSSSPSIHLLLYIPSSHFYSSFPSLWLLLFILEPSPSLLLLFFTAFSSSSPHTLFLFIPSSASLSLHLLPFLSPVLSIYPESKFMNEQFRCGF